MDDTPGSRRPARPVRGPQAQTEREARLKAALKANMARRKAQARAREGDAAETNDPDPLADGQQQDG